MGVGLFSQPINNRTRGNGKESFRLDIKIFIIIIIIYFIRKFPSSKNLTYFVSR